MPGEEREVRDEEERQEEKEGVEKPEEREEVEKPEARDGEEGEEREVKEGEESGVVVMDLKRSEDSNFAIMLLLDYASNMTFSFELNGL